MAFSSISMRQRSQASLVLFLFLGGFAAVANANAFLGRLNQNASSSLTPESERSLLSELETALGSGHRHATEKRLNQIEKIMTPMFAAMTKNENGKLGSAAVGYMLHRVFVQRHGWFIKALEPAGNSHGAWDSSAPISILENRVPEQVQTLFENRLGQHGLGLKEVAVLASSIEHLVHSEALHRTRLSYAATNFSQEDALSQDEAKTILEMYMSVLLTGYTYDQEVSTKEIKKAKKLYANIEKIFPSWPVTKQWMEEVFHSVAPKRDYLYFGDVESVVSEIGERYGDYEDIECKQFKDWLVAVEDTGVGGAGRVRMSDFYGQALNNGKWQFSESIGYLRELGALDESDASNPRLIIPNYVQAQSNCIQTSAYYSVCCQDECEGILGRLEELVSAPEASPSTLLSMIPMIASASMPSGRTLSPWLHQRLDEVASHHGGLVPLHGRLFAQWLHYAYPRECSFPHAAGSINPVQISDVSTNQTGYEPTLKKAEMQRIVDEAPARKSRIPGSEAAVHEESALWSMEENLVVRRPAKQPVEEGSSWFSGRAFVMVVAVASMSIALVKNLQPALENLQGGKASSADKYYV